MPFGSIYVRPCRQGDSLQLNIARVVEGLPALFGPSLKRIGSMNLSVSCHWVGFPFKVFGALPLGRVLPNISSSGLCPLVRHYGDQFTRERVKLFQGTLSLSLVKISLALLFLPFFRMTTVTW